LGGDGGLGLNVLDGGENGADFDVITFLDVEVGDTSKGGGAYVDVGLGLDLAGAADDGDQVLPGGLADDDFGDIGLAAVYASGNDPNQDEDG
jgi:hypothetical protein